MLVAPSEPGLASSLERAGFEVVLEPIVPLTPVDPRWNFIVCDAASALGWLGVPGLSVVVVAPAVKPEDAVALIRRGVRDVIASTDELAVVLERRRRELAEHATVTRLLTEQLAHELNSQLTALRLCLELVDGQVTGLDRQLDREHEVESFLGDARRATERLSQLVAKRLDHPEPIVTPLTDQLQRGRILIVEDEAALAHVLRRILSDHDVDVVEDGRAALARILDGDRFDVILCDVMMPHMTGIEFHAELSRHDQEQARRFAFMTGGTLTPDAATFLDAVPNPVLAKPFGADHVRSVVRALLVVA